MRFPRRVHRHHERHDDTPSSHPAKCPKCAHPVLIYSDATTLILSVRQQAAGLGSLAGAGFLRAQLAVGSA